MSIGYNKIRDNLKTFQRIWGLSVAPFNIILEKVAPKWHIALTSRYKRPGRDYNRAIRTGY